MALTFEELKNRKDTGSSPISMSNLTEETPGKTTFESLKKRQNVGGGFNFDSFGEGEANLLQEEEGLGTKFLKGIIQSETNFGKQLGGAAASALYGNTAEENRKRYMQAGDDYIKLAKNTIDPVKKETYINLSQQSYDKASKTLEEIVGKDWMDTTNKEVMGAAAGTFLDTATAGTYGIAAKTAKSGQLLKPLEEIPTVINKLPSEKIKTGVKKMAAGASIGYSFDVTSSLQNNEGVIDALTPGFATLVGAGLPAFGLAYGVGKDAMKPGVLEDITKTGIEKGVKPSVAGKTSVGKMDEYFAKVADAVKSIINNKENLKFKDEFGEEIIGQLPKNLTQFSSAIDQTKKVIFDEYDALAKASDESGIEVGFNDIVEELRKASNDKVLNLRDPRTAAYAEDMAERFEQIGSLTPNKVQQLIQEMNADLNSFYRNPTYGSATKVQLDAMIVNILRKSLDNAIETTTGSGKYQQLKNLYGALKAIEKDVNHRTLIDARKNNASLTDYSDIFTYGDIASGVISMNPGQVTRGLLGKGIQAFYKMRNDPNRIISTMFQRAEDAVKNGRLKKQVDNPPLDEGSWINRMFPQEGGESPSGVLDSAKNYIKSKGGASIEDVSGGQSGYRYHETSTSSLESIKKNGLIPSNGMYGKGVYFSPTIGKGEASKTGLLVRSKVDDLKNNGYDEFDDEGWTENVVKPDNLEYSKDGGKTWFKASKNDKKVAILQDGKTKIVNESEVPKGVTKYSLETGDIIKDKIEPFVNDGQLSTKILGRLEGKTETSKQYISDLLNSGDIKKSEADLIRGLLEQEKGSKVNIPEFADKVKAELLPLKIAKKGIKDEDIYEKRIQEIEEMYNNGEISDEGYNELLNEIDIPSSRYEKINLPKEVRGKVIDYKENVYESPIKTSAGSVHFPDSNKYFGHTRTEDMAPEWQVGGTTYKSESTAKVFGDNPIKTPKTRRVIEVQSDLFQKGRLENDTLGYLDENSTAKTIEEAKANMLRDKAKLQQYNNPTAHFRMIREEVKKAAEDGVERLQFPTGETGMKIEGLGDNVQFYDVARMNETRANGMASDLQRQGEALSYATLKPTELKVGQEVSQGAGNQWIITDVLENGKFKAMQKRDSVGFELKDGILQERYTQGGEVGWSPVDEGLKETFDVSGKVDTNNPIYKFYEKEVGKYLKNNYKAELVTDKQGVSWWEIDLKGKGYDKKPVNAFGFAKVGTLIGGAASLAGGQTVLSKIKEKSLDGKVFEQKESPENTKKKNDEKLPYVSEKRNIPQEKQTIIGKAINNNVEKRIREKAKEMGFEDVDKLIRVAFAESSLNPKAKNKDSSATGIFQILDMHGLSKEDRENVEKATEWAIKKIRKDGYSAWKSSEKMWKK